MRPSETFAPKNLWSSSHKVLPLDFLVTVTIVDFTSFWVLTIASLIKDTSLSVFVEWPYLSSFLPSVLIRSSLLSVEKVLHEVMKKLFLFIPLIRCRSLKTFSYWLIHWRSLRITNIFRLWFSIYVGFLQFVPYGTELDSSLLKY